jgi:hypothetical protein
VAEEAQQIETDHQQSSDIAETNQFSVVEQTVVAASKCVSSEEPGLQTTLTKAHHRQLSGRHGKKPRAHQSDR